jgi:hypothetical protein
VSDCRSKRCRRTEEQRPSHTTDTLPVARTTSSTKKLQDCCCSLYVRACLRAVPVCLSSVWKKNTNKSRELQRCGKLNTPLTSFPSSSCSGSSSSRDINHLWLLLHCCCYCRCAQSAVERSTAAAQKKHPCAALRRNKPAYVPPPVSPPLSLHRVCVCFRVCDRKRKKMCAPIRKPAASK